MELWEISLIIKGTKEREAIAPRVLTIAARNNYASEEELF